MTERFRPGSRHARGLRARLAFGSALCARPTFISVLRARPTFGSVLRACNAVLTGIGYVAYPLLLVCLALFARDLLLRCVVVPAVGFAICMAVRLALNAPRPYEVAQCEPLIPKSTHGKSFPSRHTFCMFTIACSWLVWQPVVGIVALVLACLLAAIRVWGGVHFPRDVIAGAILAIVFCALGYCCIPW